MQQLLFTEWGELERVITAAAGHHHLTACVKASCGHFKHLLQQYKQIMHLQQAENSFHLNPCFLLMVMCNFM